MLLTLSSRYQSWFGHRRIESSIDAWLRSERISNHEAAQLRQQLSGSEVRAYVRGLGAHLALKTFAPIMAPAKYGGIAAFVASGNLWFLLPMLLMPIVRTMVTLASWWSTRGERIPHGEALLSGLLPVVGSIAFPLQMYAARSDLSIFLIRDAAAKLGRHIPIYGGPNSRTEIALIRSTDALVELLDVVSSITGRLHRWRQSSHRQDVAMTIQLPNRTRLALWVDRLAVQQIAEHELQPKPCRDSTTEAALGRLEAA
jgi:hypothetical protein